MIYIWGAGGFGQEAYWYFHDHWNAESAEPFPAERVAFLDDEPGDVPGLPAPIAGRPDDVELGPEDEVIVGVGFPEQRREIAQRAVGQGATLRTVIHPTSWVAPDAKLAAGCIVCPFVFVATMARLAENVLLNTYASVGHHGVVGAHSVLSPYAVINGNANLGDEVFMGTHATVTPGVVVGAGTIVGAASLVRKDLPAASLAVGNPLKTKPLNA